jgi:hypothetical protein
MVHEQLTHVPALEELAPFHRHGVRVLEVLVEDEAGIPRVQAVDVARSHEARRAGCR